MSVIFKAMEIDKLGVFLRQETSAWLQSVKKGSAMVVDRP